jgi:hypothetical protein
MLRIYRWPIAMGIAGLILCAMASMTLIQGFGGWHTSFEAPGSVDIQIPEAGEYRLWHESKTLIDGRLYVVDDKLPAGTVIGFTDSRGRSVPLDTDSGSMYQESGEMRRVAVGRIEVPEAGIYTASITGFEGPRKFRLSEIRFLEHFLRALLFALPGFALAIAALVWAVVISTRRQ